MAIVDKKEYDKIYRLQNKEKIKAYKKKWRLKNAEKIKAYKDKNKELIAAYNKVRYQNNKDALRQMNKEYREKNKERISAHNKKRYQENKEIMISRSKEQYVKHKEKRLARKKEYIKENKEKVRAYWGKRRADKNMRTPKWLSKDDLWILENAYELAHIRSSTFGFDWHVDHIIPLRGTTVSGLHVPNNIQVVPATWNLQKSNVAIESFFG